MQQSYASIKKEIEKMKKYNKTNPLFIDIAVISSECMLIELIMAKKKTFSLEI